MKGPERIETARLLLRRPRPADAEAIFSRYASDPGVTRYMGWPTQRSIEEARAFLERSEVEWREWPAGAYLIESRAGGALLGGTGLHFESPTRAATGYILARDAWGAGYATEALNAIVEGEIATCVFPLDSVPPVIDNIGVKVNGVLVPQDTTKTDGWDYVDDTYMAVEVYGSWCEQIKTTAANTAEIIFGCPGVEIK